MLSKKQLLVILLGAMLTFFLVALLVYTFYIESRQPNKVELTPSVTTKDVELHTEEKQIVMSQQVPQIQSSTNVIFEIVDQFGIVTQTDMYPGINWRNSTRSNMEQMFPDYEITRFGEDKVILTKVIQRQIMPSYMITTQGDDIIIATEKNGNKTFYRSTGLYRNDISDKLYQILDKGIHITIEQKEAILRDVDELYVILQEHDE